MICPIHCGFCCKSIAQTIVFTREDIDKWTEEDRYDILKHIDIYVEGKQVRGFWKKELLKPNFVCPFLGVEGCTIKDLKPDKCLEYHCKKSKEAMKDVIVRT